jgi:transketolase
VTDKPSLIKIRTTIGYGSAKEGTHGVHGAPLGPEDISNVKKKFGMSPDESYFVIPEVKKYYERAANVGQTKRDAWNKMFEQYLEKYPTEASELRRRLAGHFPENIKFPTFEAGHKDATRGYSGKVLAAISPSIPEMLCGSADLSPSNKTNNAGWGTTYISLHAHTYTHTHTYIHTYIHTQEETFKQRHPKEDTFVSVFENMLWLRSRTVFTLTVQTSYRHVRRS